MNFGLSFALHLSFIACFDTCWLTLNFKCYPGKIYPSAATSKRSFFVTMVFCILCWIVSALHLAGHQHDSVIAAALESAWTGSLVYAVYNFTTYITTDEWRLFPVAFVDTLWGACLFASAAAITATLDITGS